jgi:hypothetical protein
LPGGRRFATVCDCALSAQAIAPIEISGGRSFLRLLRLPGLLSCWFRQPPRIERQPSAGVVKERAVMPADGTSSGRKAAEDISSQPVSYFDGI